jgi:glyoxylase-like metal-dependent hydrolase (beta-lactamase superfamily II)
MPKRLWIALCLFVSLTSFAQSPRESATEKSCARAREVLDAGIKAMGGLDALKAINNISREMAGVRTDEGQGLRPVRRRGDYYRNGEAPVVNHPKIKHVHDLRGQRLSDSLDDVIFGGQPLRIRNILTRDSAISIDYNLGTMEVRQLPNAAMARVNRSMRYPEILLPMARDRVETLRYLGESQYEGQKQWVISFAHQNGAQISLFFNAQTGLLTKSEILSDHPVLGDTADEIVYDDWRPVGKLTLPFRYINKVGGVMLQDLRAESITIDAKLDESLFVAPEGLAKVERTPPARKAVKLGEDVYLAPGEYNSVFVVFNDYVLALEAGSDNQTSANLIAQIKETAPGKPIRYLVSTHFHFDHISGARSFIAEGTTIVTTPDAKSVIERVAAATHARRPDALSLSPRAAVIETFKGKRVFDDGAHRVELYEFSNPHCAEMIIAWLPKEKILFEADMLDITYPGHIGEGGEDTAALLGKIQELGLAVERIVPVHGQMGTMDNLHRAVSRLKSEGMTK